MSNKVEATYHGASYRWLADHPSSSPEWHALRVNGIGGSEIAAIMGKSPYESRFSLWHRKKGTVGPVAENEMMRWGKALEAPILARYMTEHPEYITGQRGTFQNLDRPYQIANPDCLLHPKDDPPIGSGDEPVRLLEIKTSPMGDGWGRPGSDIIPEHYRMQVLWYLDTFDLKVADIAVLISGCDYREYTVHWDEGKVGTLRAFAQDFMNSLEDNHRPDIDAHGETYVAIKELNPDIDPLPTDIKEQTAIEFINSRRVLAEAEARASLARNILADEMGTAKAAFWDGHKIADRRVKNGGRPYVQAANKLPDTTETSAT